MMNKDETRELLGRNPNKHYSLCPLWCPNQDHLPSLKGIYRVANLARYVLLGYLRLRWVSKSASETPSDLTTA